MLRKNGTPVTFEVVCEGLQFPEGPIALPDGSLIIVEIARGTLTRIAPDGKASVAADIGAGPNGAAIGPDGAVYICNNGGFVWHREPGITRVIGTPQDYSGGRIERVDLRTGKFERLYDRCGEHKLNGPNDLVFDRHGGFYFTDHGKTLRAPHRSRRGVLRARRRQPDQGSDLSDLDAERHRLVARRTDRFTSTRPKPAAAGAIGCSSPARSSACPIRRRTAARCCTAPAASRASTASNAKPTAASASRRCRTAASPRSRRSMASPSTFRYPTAIRQICVSPAPT